MPNAPRPITSPPAVTGQPYDATAPGAAEDQTVPTTIYDAVPGDAMGGPWRKVQNAGASDTSGKASDVWPGNGASGDGGWKQT